MITLKQGHGHVCFHSILLIASAFPRPLFRPPPPPLLPYNVDLLKLSYVYPRDNDGYYWLTGRVDDVINVRYLTLLHFLVIGIIFFVDSWPRKTYL